MTQDVGSKPRIPLKETIGDGLYGSGSKKCTQNGTLVSGNMDQNLRSPGGLILTHTYMGHSISHSLPLAPPSYRLLPRCRPAGGGCRARGRAPGAGLGLKWNVVSGIRKQMERLGQKGRFQQLASWMQTKFPSSALLPFFGGGFPTKIDYRKKSTRILTSRLEDLAKQIMNESR